MSDININRNILTFTDRYCIFYILAGNTLTRRRKHSTYYTCLLRYTYNKYSELNKTKV